MDEREQTVLVLFPHQQRAGADGVDQGSLVPLPFAVPLDCPRDHLPQLVEAHCAVRLRPNRQGQLGHGQQPFVERQRRRSALRLGPLGLVAQPVFDQLPVQFRGRDLAQAILGGPQLLFRQFRDERQHPRRAGEPLQVLDVPNQLEPLFRGGAVLEIVM